ncbi:MAG: Proton-translocating NADH-quinone oxidoreductase, chain M [Cenarchaeum symbiont of Oopsacas minuta]|nr:Proton-translocating NADH-quinone oxidoreductase, chain M [Cenarchaeum symbiont of Oopsacas minuta]
MAYILGKRWGISAAMWFTFGLLLYCTVLIITASLQGGYEERYPWTELFGEFGFVLDGLASPFAILIYVMSTILAVYSKPYMVHKFKEKYAQLYNSNQNSDGTETVVAGIESEKFVNSQSGTYYALFLVFAMGMLGTILSTNLIEFYIFFEVMLIPGFFLVAFWGDGARRKISLMFLFWTHVGAVVLLLGFLAIGLSLGSFDYIDIASAELTGDIMLFAAVAILIGLGVKLAAFMFHVWLPWVHGAAPTPISALLSPVMIGIGAYGIFRLVIEFMPIQYEQLAIWLHVWGLVTMIYGGAMALMQDDIKRLFAYSSISQMGYLLFGIGSYSATGLAGAEMMYVTHALGKGLLFMTAGILIVNVGTRSLSKLGGLAGKMPITAVCAVIGAMTIMGVPPTSGFMGEWIVFYGALETAIEEGSTLRMVTFGLGMLATALTMAYMLWMLKRVFFGKLPENLSHAKDGSWYMLVPMMILAGFTIVLGIYPDIFLEGITGYMNGVLGGA